MTKITVYKVKRKRGFVWMLRWYDSRGRRCGETVGDCRTMTRRQAEAIRRERQGKIDCGVILADKPKRMTLAAFVAQDRQAIEADVRPTTMLEYGHAVKHALAALGPEIVLDRIGAVEVGQIKMYLKSKGRATATIRKSVKMLSSIMRRAKDHGSKRDLSDPRLGNQGA